MGRKRAKRDPGRGMVEDAAIETDVTGRDGPNRKTSTGDRLPRRLVGLGRNWTYGPRE